MKPEVALIDNEDLEEVSQDVDWQFVSLGEQQNFGIKTSGMYVLFHVNVTSSVCVMNVSVIFNES